MLNGSTAPSTAGGPGSPHTRGSEPCGSEPDPRSSFDPETGDPERIAWDGALTLAERRECLARRYRAASRQLSGPHGPAALIEMQRILEAIQVLDARSRADDDWAHFLRESAFA